MVSPQFHLFFYENFETVPNLWAGNVTENWEQLVASSKENSLEGFYNVTKTWFEGKIDPSADPQAAANHQTSSLAASQPNGGLQQAPVDFQISFLRIMFLLVALKPLGIHNKCMVLNLN